MATSHNSQSSFARRMLPSSAAAIAWEAEASSPCRLPSPIINDQKQTDRPLRGKSVGVACQLVPARWRGRGRVSSAGICTDLIADAFSAFDCCPPLTRRLLLIERSRHFFRVRVGSSRRSAINLKSLERHFQCVTQRYPGHFVNSVSSAPKLSRGQVNDVPQFQTSGATHDR